VIIPGFEARIVDDDNRSVAQGEIGNLLVKADSTCAYYWNQHQKTKDTIEGHWIRTGDKYYQDEDGYFWYAGRADDMLKVSGVWVSPIEIERALIEHPAVQEAPVVFRRDEDELPKPVARVVTRDKICPERFRSSEDVGCFKTDGHLRWRGLCRRFCRPGVDINSRQIELQVFPARPFPQPPQHAAAADVENRYRPPHRKIRQGAL